MRGIGALTKLCRKPVLRLASLLRSGMIAAAQATEDTSWRRRGRCVVLPWYLSL
jgi:hypothetical protein